MSTAESEWNENAPPPKSKRKFWWILGCGGCAVLSIIPIGIGATIVVPNVMAARKRAQELKVKVDLTTLNAVVEEYKLKRGAYPSSWNDLLAEGKTVPQDPWGHDYVLIAGEDLQTRPRIFTYGRDGVRGGENEDADVEYTPR